MMKKAFFLAVTVFVLGSFGTGAFAHFGMVIPSDTMVMQGEKKVVKVAGGQKDRESGGLFFPSL